MSGSGRLWSLWIGAALAGAMIAIAIVSFVWTPLPPTKLDIARKLAAPSSLHPLGSDHFGRDTLSMLMAGARASLSVAGSSVGLGALIGVPAGLIAAARPGLIDEIVARIVDLMFAFPALLTAILIAAAIGPGPTGAVAALAVFNAAVLARVTRGAARRIWSLDFIRAAAAMGRGRASTTLVHILPNVAGVVIVQATSLFATAILNEAALSYLGLGVRPPAPSWGRMLADAQTLLFTSPTQAIYPGAAIALTVLGFNLLGDGLRDLLDPKHDGTASL